MVQLSALHTASDPAETMRQVPSPSRPNHRRNARSAGLARGQLRIAPNVDETVRRAFASQWDSEKFLSRPDLGSLRSAMFKDLRYNIAVHESGHALVGLSCGLHILGMYIDPDDKSSGTKFLHQDFSRLTLDDQVTVTLAGAEA